MTEPADTETSANFVADVFDLAMDLVMDLVAGFGGSSPFRCR